MNKLPRGTVTFRFTDIEGSTRLLHDLGDAYAEALAEHRRLLRDAFGRHGGIEGRHAGDAFFVAFARAGDALAAARAGQQALAGRPIRVRMGLHTGEPVVTEEGYVGLDVHRAARLAAVGHGGQVLLSQATRELVGLDELRDLGAHRLKDLTAPERVYQVGQEEFPPLKSLNATNLPWCRIHWSAAKRSSPACRETRGRRTARHADGARRQREDAPRAAGGCRAPRCLSGRRLRNARRKASRRCEGTGARSA